jgi:hypothetical protein
MSARILAVIPAGHEPAALTGITVLIALARAQNARVRLACFKPMPRPRLDRHDRVVAAPDQEMARITAATTETFREATRVFNDVAIETVVRFGSPRYEAKFEADAFHPDLIAFFAPRPATPPDRLWMRMLRRHTARANSIRLVVLDAPRPGRGASRRSPLSLPRWRDAM